MVSSSQKYQNPLGKVLERFTRMKGTSQGFRMIYPLVNKQFDPENKQFIVETSPPTPMNGRVYVNLLEGRMS